MNSKDIRNLQEAYMEVYGELDEGASEDVAARASKLARQRKGQTPQRRAMYQQLASKAETRASGETPGDKPQGHPLRKASSRPTFPSDSKYSRKGLTQSKRDERRDIEAATHGEYSDGPGGVTKNPKKLRKQKAMGEIPESYSIYDILISHLLDEGYAETYEAAEKIMVNMSEEWRDDIVEGFVSPYEGKASYNNPQAHSPATRAMQRSDELQRTEPGSRRQRMQTRRSQQLNRMFQAARRA